MQLAEQLWCRFATREQQHSPASLKRRRMAALLEALKSQGVVRPFKRTQEGWAEQVLEEWVLPNWFLTGQFRHAVTEAHGLRNWTQQQLTLLCE